MQKLQMEGYVVPNDISVISFDNTQLSQDCVPKLSTIDINKYEFGAEALSLMLNRIKTPHLPLQYAYIRGNLIIRESV